MTPDEMRIAAAISQDFKWYRHPGKHFGPPRRFLAHHPSHEYSQSPQWIVPADMTEKPCSMEYMESEFHLPKYDTDQNAVDGLAWTLSAEEKQPEGEAFLQSERGHYCNALERIVGRDLAGAAGEHYYFNIFNAKPVQKLEAYLRAKGLYRDTV